MTWSPAGNTDGFGRGLDDGRPFWTGRFTGGKSSEILFYSPADGNWWLGRIIAGELKWSAAGNTDGFGRGLDDGRPFWTGAFSRSGAAEILFYSPADGNWWLGRMTAGVLGWSLVGNTDGFGRGLDDGRPIWVGEFSRSGVSEILYYSPADGNWWLGKVKAGALKWVLAGNTDGFGRGLDDGRPFWIGRFSGARNAEVLFYSPVDSNWWLGQMVKDKLQWSLAGNTAGFGPLADGRPIWTGAFMGGAQTGVLFYSPSDHQWWFGAIAAGQFGWTRVSDSTPLPAPSPAV